METYERSFTPFNNQVGALNRRKVCFSKHECTIVSSRSRIHRLGAHGSTSLQFRSTCSCRCSPFARCQLVHGSFTRAFLCHAGMPHTSNCPCPSMLVPVARSRHISSMPTLDRYFAQFRIHSRLSAPISRTRQNPSSGYLERHV